VKAVFIQQLVLRDFRNIRNIDVEPSRSTNIIFGNNGQGKTSLLEAIYLLATTKSFRTHRIREIIHHEAEIASVRALIDCGGVTRSQIAAFSSNQRTFKIDDKKPENIASYAIASPVVVFHPGELMLTMGPASVRRTLLDRVALFLDPQSLEANSAYSRALKSRQKLLQAAGCNAAGLDAYEDLMARHGAALAYHRKNSASFVISACRTAFEKLAPEGLSFDATYDAGGTDDAQLFRKTLEEKRSVDARRPSPVFGPQRDDVLLKLNARTARTVASQGQHRLLTLALKLAEMNCVTQATGKRPVLLLDDVSSELDASRTQALISLLGTESHQLFVTTTRRDLLSGFESSDASAKSFEIADGTLMP
jgi:DNA replication and repair protein RecF